MKAVILGARGQDGRLLSEHLESLNYEIFKFGREESLKFSSVESIIHFLKENNPEEIYLLSAYHHASTDEALNEQELWSQSFKVHFGLTLSWLEAVRVSQSKAKVFYASSSLVFGRASGHLDENTPLAPICAYGVSKVAGMNLCRYYREKYGLFVAVGILFNHESEYRPSRFVSKKIVESVSAIQKEQTKLLKLGSLTSETDWGYARDYVKAMQMILQHHEPQDFIIATGVLRKLEKFVETAFLLAGLNYRDYVEVDQKLLSRVLPSRSGNASKLKTLTGWQPETSFEKMLAIMLRHQGVSIEN
jgi:GDPmannose 4,6-dehydratase